MSRINPLPGLRSAPPDYPGLVAYNRLTRIARYLSITAHNLGGPPVDMAILIQIDKAQRIIRLESELAGYDLH